LQKKQDVSVLQTNGSGVLSFATASGGKVLQVVTATDSTVRSTTSTSFVTASNTLTVTITPSSASNKIMLLLGTVGRTDNNIEGFLGWYRNAVNITGSGGFGYYFSGSSGNGQINAYFPYLDSPSSTSALTYQLYIKTSGGDFAINRGGVPANLFAFEIAG